MPYAWRFKEEESDTDVLVIGSGGGDFWRVYGPIVTIVSWGEDDG